MLTGLVLVLLAVAAMTVLTAITGWAAAGERAAVAESRLRAWESWERHRQWMALPRLASTTTAADPAYQATHAPLTQELPPMLTPDRRRVIVAAPLLAFLAVILGACDLVSDIAPFTNPDPDATHVVVFGDSLGRMSQDQALARFATDPGVSVSYNAAGGTQATGWIKAMGKVTGGHCVVYELGTNDISANTSHQAQWNTLAAFNELADADRVVAFTLNTTGGDLRGVPFAQRTREYNDFLRLTVANGTYPNLVLYDWEARSAGHTDWLLGPLPPQQGDVLHHNATGQREFADAVVDAASMCP
jgi:hypothetical protein